MIQMGGAPRVRHAVIAIAIAAVLALITILRPLDITLWSLQSKLFSHEPSGEIVLVGEFNHTLDGSVESTNSLLLSALRKLEKSDVDQVVIDTPLRASGSAELDQSLRNAIDGLGDRVVIAAPVVDAANMAEIREANAPLFDGAAPVASSDFLTDFLGFVWNVGDSVEVEGRTYPAVWSVLSGSPTSVDVLHPDFTIDRESIPQIDISELAQGEARLIESFAGKKVLIGTLGGDDRRVRIPDNSEVFAGSAELHAIAAETALRMAGSGYTSIATLPFFGCLLLLLVLGRIPGRVRRAGYAIWFSMFVIGFVASAEMGLRVMLSEPLVLAFAFGIQRVIAHWRRRHLYTDPRSGLSNFVALQRDLEARDSLTDEVIVVTKIARLEAIFATVRGGEQGEYLRQIAGRLTLGEERSTIYHDGGKYLAMVLLKSDYPDLQGHLEGLRAVASQAVVIGDRTIDVAITVGVDQSSTGRPSNRISSAIAAADQAREAYRPVFVISDFETDSETWDYSLQSRLEAALSENRISIKLQPKVEMQSGLFVGAEALARWTDRERGEIPPNQFILQCERAGRLDDLTKRVMNRSFAASRELEQAGLPARISVNVSAIQFVDSRIVEWVEEAMVMTSVNPANVMIEITETARIDNARRARDVMERIKKLGVEFSIDDFGVGSGNLDALYNLPFDELKIDRMFTNTVAHGREARLITSSLMKLSRDLGLRSVAEGIDNLATFEMLRDMGGDLAQGYCIARPQTLPLLKETLRLQAQGGIARRT